MTSTAAAPNAPERRAADRFHDLFRKEFGRRALFPVLWFALPLSPRGPSRRHHRRAARRKRAGRRDADLDAVRLGSGERGVPPSPGGTKEQADWFNELQHISTSPTDAVRNLLAIGETDVSAMLGQVSP
jgi:hypothetical protein